MLIVESYALAVVLCVVTMLCWGSWANTQKLASREWRFQLFYWDYAIGVLLLALVLAFTAGEHRRRGARLPRRPRPGRRAAASASPSSGASSSTSRTSCWSPPSTSPAWPSPSRSAWAWPSSSASSRTTWRPRWGTPCSCSPGWRASWSPSCSRPLAYRRLPEPGRADERQGDRPLGRGRPPDGLLLPLRRGVDVHRLRATCEPGQAGPLHRGRRLLARAAALQLPLEHDRDGAPLRGRAGALRRLLPRRGRRGCTSSASSAA